MLQWFEWVSQKSGCEADTAADTFMIVLFTLFGVYSRLNDVSQCVVDFVS